MNKLIRIYVAGAISSNNVLTVFENIRRGIQASTELFLSKRYSPFCPFLDYQFLFFKPEDVKIDVTIFHQYSIAWLEQSEAVLVLPGSEKSIGTLGEITRANELGIPIFYSREDLDFWANGQMMLDFQTSLNDLEV